MDKALTLQILGQNLRKTPRRPIKFTIDGYDVTFQRCDCPQIIFNVMKRTLQLYGRGGDTSKHLEPLIIYFEDNFDRDEIFDILVKTLETVSKKIK